MSDRTNILTVVLKNEMRIDDCQKIIDAINMIRGVLTTQANISDVREHMAIERARADLGEKIIKAIYP